MPYIPGKERQSLVLVEVTIDDHGETYPAYFWWCPGCASWDPDGSVGAHIFYVPPWTFDNDDMDTPSFSASYLVYARPAHDQYKGQPRCHSFVKNGMIQYLGDSEHSLQGQTIPMAPVPDWLRHEKVGD